MKKLIKTKTILHSAIVVCSSIFIVAGIVSAATTIGTNIVTGGTLSVTGTSSLGIISSGTWNGTAIDISSYTNLAVANNLALTGDTIGVAAGYTIPATSSVANWNTAYGWGNHASAGYLTAVEIATNTDLAVTDNLALKGAGETIGVASGYNIPLTASTTEWATAYGWGNHALAGYLTTVDVSSDTNLAVANNLALTGDTLGVMPSYNIPLTASTTEWATAYGWGNHASAGYLLATSTSDLDMNGNQITGVNSLGVMGDAIVGDLAISSSTYATSTLEVGISGSSAACLRFQDTDLGGWTYCSFLNGVMSCGTSSCE